MTSKKVTMVTLEVKANGDKKGYKRDFEVGHAERILLMERNGGWELPKDSKFTFNVKDGIRANRIKGQGKVS